jgi:RNA polymerase sigma-70 factor (ECF subfamily)
MNCTKEQIDLTLAKCQAANTPGENFRPIFDCYYPMVLRYFKAQNNVRPEDCEDLTQEVFVLVYNNVKDFRRDAAFTTWLRRIMTNHLVDYLRKNGLTKDAKHAPPVSLDSFYEDGDQLALDVVELSLDSNPQEMALDGEFKTIYWEALNSLPPQMRSCILLRLQEHTYQEIADQLRLTSGAVSKHLHDGRLRIQTYLKRRYAGLLPGKL